MYLSELQRLILSMARKRGGSVSNQDVLKAYYGAGLHPNARHVAVCKAFNRLEARGLVRRVYNLGVVLVEEEPANFSAR